jgi:LysR family glycine cleavage system transcriptional activator
MIDWPNMPPLAALRGFAAYAEAGSVSDAGAKLNVSHAAISQQIRALEGFLQTPLLDRSGRKAELTEEGLRLARAVETGFGAIWHEIEELTGAGQARPVVVSATPSMASSWLLPRLAGFRAAHPEVDLMIDASAEVKALKPGGIDVALRYGDGSWPGLEADLLVRSPVVVVAAPSLLAALPEEGVTALARYPWLQELGTTEASDFLRRQGALPEPGQGMVSLPGNLMLEAARAGQGLAAVSRVSVEADLAAGRLVELVRDEMRKGYYIVTLPGPHRPALKAFLRWLRRQADPSGQTRSQPE